MISKHSDFSDIVVAYKYAMLQQQIEIQALELLAKFKRKLKWKPMAKWLKSPEQLEVDLDKVYTDTGCVPEAWIRGLILQLKEQFNMDPQSPYIHFPVYYWNPTNHKVNIAPLGIHNTTVVEPGAHVPIPFPHTIGGKRSAITGVAPQLKALPRAGEDTLLDLKPTSLIEWATYFTYTKLTDCCRKCEVWDPQD